MIYKVFSNLFYEKYTLIKQKNTNVLSIIGLFFMLSVWSYYFEFFKLFIITTLTNDVEFELIYSVEEYYTINSFLNEDFFNEYKFFHTTFNFLIGILNLKNLFYYLYTDAFNVPFFFMFFMFFMFTIIISYFFQAHLGLYGTFIINLISLTIFWLSLIPYLSFFFMNNSTIIVNFGESIWFSFNNKLKFIFLFDSISFSFIFLTTTIALFVLIYAFAYFRYEPLVDRFILFLCSFVISMLFLVSSGNLIMLFLGWELIGFTSFLLINFWTTRTGTLKSAFKAFSFNKLSDVFLLLFIIISFNIFYDLDISIINNKINLIVFNNINIFSFSINYVELLSLLLLSAAFIKSAQFGPHIWLPDSMEAPVPASSLIHSATLVSAGIFLILRFHPIFEYSTLSNYILLVVGSFTAAYGGVVASYVSDIKKILAYSTISHCGFLMVLCAIKINEFVILYLYVHGFFKAAVFMCVGNVIRISRGYQDFRRMGMFYKNLPFECFGAFICLLNLSGLPFSLGFTIKHLLFITTTNSILNIFILFNLVVGALSGLIYSFRLFYNVFFDFKKARKITYNYMNRINNNNSSYYSNTSLASNLSICLLIIISYLTILFLFFIILNKVDLTSDFFNTITTINIFKYNFNSKLELFYLSYLNIIVLIIIFFILNVTWRKNHTNYFTNIISFFIFLGFFFLNMNLI